MSGHHPPSWNHHPMQVPPYIPRQLPMAHMSNERPMSGSWHNSSSVVPSGPPPSQNHPSGGHGHAMNPEHNPYPYLGGSNRKLSMDMNPMLPPSQYGNRHSMAGPANNDYDSSMMDLSVSRNNHNHHHQQQQQHHQFMNNTSPRDLQHLHAASQDYTNNKLHGKDSCDGPLLPPANGQVGDGFPSEMDILNRRQNPVGLPPMADAMELVKEALLNKIKSQAPLIGSSDLVGGGGIFNNQEQFPEPLIHKPPSIEEGVNLSVDGAAKLAAAEVENSNSSSAVKESRRKTRKPNKTSKVVNEETDESMNVTQGRSSTEGEELKPVDESRSAQEEEKVTKVEINSSPHPPKRPASDSTEATPTTENNTSSSDVSEVAKKKRRNRRSNDQETTPKKEEEEKVTDTPDSKSNGGGGEEESQNGKIEAEKGDKGTPPVDPEASYEEVESKLSEMFAGIEDAPHEEATTKEKNKSPEKEEEKSSPDPPPPSSTKRKPIPGRRNSILSLSALIGDVDIETDDDEDFSLEPKKKQSKGRKKTPAKKGGSRSNGGGSNNGGGSSSATTGGNKRKTSKGGPGGKKKKKGGGGSKWDDEQLPVSSKKQPKDTEEGRYRGPLLQVRHDGSLGVLNGPQGQAEDDPDARNGGKSKKFLHNGVAERNKVIRGLHTNTLSMKYDTDRTDTTWICVFCKLGPHKLGLGDLFGPYMVTTDCDEYRLMEAQAGDVFKSSRSRMDMVQSAPHRMPAVPASGSPMAALLKSPNSKAPVPAKRGPKKKQQQQLAVDNAVAGSSSSPAEDLYLGLTKATETSYEIWMHEDCIVWGSGIHMIAGRLVGAEDAVWGSTSSRCSLCRKTGAVVCCLQRGCNERVHAPCGRQSNWLLDEEVLNSYCQLHGGGQRVGTDPQPTTSNIGEPSTSSR